MIHKKFSKKKPKLWLNSIKFAVFKNVAQNYSPFFFRSQKKETAATTNQTTNQDLFSSKPPTKSNLNSLTDDLLSLENSSHVVNNAPTTMFQPFEPSAPKSKNVIWLNREEISFSLANLFDDILRPTSTSLTSINNPQATTVTKPFQSGDLNSSLNHLIENLDMKDHTRVR